MLRSIGFLFREFLDGIGQNRFLHFAYGAQVSVSLLVLGIFFVLLVGAASFWSRLVAGMEVRAFLEDTVDNRQLQDIGEQLSGIEHVKDVVFRTKEEALEIFKMRNPGLPLDDLLEDNPLPAAYILTVDKPAKIKDVADACKNITGVMHVTYASEFLQKYKNVMFVLSLICIATITLLLLFAYSSISNIIGVSIYARRSEIRIMQLVGATWWFIRWPFVFEGIFFGAIGAAVALGVIWLLLGALIQTLHIREMPMQLPWLDVNSWMLFVWLGIVLIGVGVLVGLFGSLKTVNTFLHREVAVTLDAAKVKQLLRS